jgi:hypothetical protein
MRRWSAACVLVACLLVATAARAHADPQPAQPAPRASWVFAGLLSFGFIVPPSGEIGLEVVEGEGHGYLWLDPRRDIGFSAGASLLFAGRHTAGFSGEAYFRILADALFWYRWVGLGGYADLRPIEFTPPTESRYTGGVQVVLSPFGPTRFGFGTDVTLRLGPFDLSAGAGVRVRYCLKLFRKMPGAACAMVDYAFTASPDGRVHRGLFALGYEL